MGYRLAAGGDAALDGIAEADFVIVAAQGMRDLDALRAALLSPAAHVAMVASRRKAATLVAKLRAEGVEEARLSRLKSPAGIDLGGIDPEEIALSVVAEIVRLRNARRARRRGLNWPAPVSPVDQVARAGPRAVTTMWIGLQNRKVGSR